MGGARYEETQAKTVLNRAPSAPTDALALPAPKAAVPQPPW